MHWVAEIVYMVYKQIISRFLSLLKLGAAFKRKNFFCILTIYFLALNCMNTGHSIDYLWLRY